MKNIIRYKGYYTKIEYSVEDQLLHGKIEGIVDLVNFEASEPADIEKEFQNAVDDYLAFCADLGKSPEKPYNGVFNVRLSPELHREAVMEAANRGITLNQLVSIAVANQITSQF